MKRSSSQSYLSVAFDLRPSKQVERRMLLDFFHRLAGKGVAVQQFRYTGMGSIHFIDHILFHKFLGIDKLVSVERDQTIKSRVEFNKPFRNVEIEMMEIGDYVPRLNDSEPHIVWLDYDYRLSEEILSDVRSCAVCLPLGSFVFVTVDTEPSKRSTGSAYNYSRYKQLSRDLWNPIWVKSDFSGPKIHLRTLSLLGRAFRQGTAGRPRIDALPFFSVVYADGHQMATIGVQIGRDTERRVLREIKCEGANYMVLEFDHKPFYIDVPVLTRRERLYLEKFMPYGDYKSIKKSGVREDDFRNFSNIYRFLPSYAELLLG